MICQRRNFSLQLLVGTAFALQFATSSNHKLFVSVAKTTTKLAFAGTSMSRPANLSERFQDQRATAGALKKPYTEDILYATKRASAFTGNSLKRKARKATRNEEHLWPNAEVPFILHDTLRNREEQLNKSFEEFQRYTCIRFRPKRTNDSDYVTIADYSSTCNSVRGRQGGVQQLSLSTFCIEKREATLHVLGHLIGFVDEHLRPDRDDHVTIRLENVRQESQQDFVKFSEAEIDSKGIPYDYLSVMHYGQNVFSKNGRTVIEAKNRSYQNIIGRSRGLSFLDVKLANLMYRCSERSKCANITCPEDGFVGQDCRCWCKCRNSYSPAEHCPDMFAKRQGIALTLTNYEQNTTFTSDEPAVHLESVRDLVAIVVGCAVTMSAVLMLQYVVRWRKHRIPKMSSMHVEALATNAVKTTAESNEYCTIAHRSESENYASLIYPDSVCTSLKPNRHHDILQRSEALVLQ